MLGKFVLRLPFAVARMACSVSVETSSSTEYSSGECSSDNDRESDDLHKRSITHEDRMEMLSVIKTMSFGGVPYQELSKNAQKKILAIRVKRKLRNLKRKELSKEKQQLQGSLVGVAETLETTPTQDEPVPWKLIKRQQLERMREALKTGQRLAVDCSMGGHMTPKEVCKLGRQINQVYSLIKTSPSPFHLFITNLVKDGGIHNECRRQSPGFDRYPIDVTDKPYHQLFPPNDIIYLTPDSPNVMETLDNSKVYVLGGLVDENIQVGHTYRRAQELKLETARLPIDLYMDKTLPEVHCCLPVNQVVGILLDIQDGKNWATALEMHIPSRKGYVLKPMYRRRN